MSSKILCVDDDQNILDAYRRNLRKQFDIDIALGAQEAIVHLQESGPYDVIVTDQHMPGMTGIQLLAQAKEIAPDTVRMMLTGNADLTTAMTALNEGQIFRFLVKPVTPENMAVVLEQGVHQYKLVTAEKELLEKTLRGSVRMLIEILSSVNPELFGRSQQLRQRMRLLSDELGQEDNWAFELAAMLCQIGMVTLPPNLFHRSEKGITLNPTEQALIDRIPEVSANLLANIPRLEPVANIIRYQNKHFDGGGRPLDDTSGSEIPIGSRMLKLLVDWQQVEARGASKFGAPSLMRSRTGWYDPKVLEAATRLFGIREEPVPGQKPLAIPVSKLRVGHVLAGNMETEDGKLLISAGHQITTTLLEKVMNYHEIAGVKEPIQVERASERTPSRSGSPGERHVA